MFEAMRNDAQTEWDHQYSHLGVWAPLNGFLPPNDIWNIPGVPGVSDIYGS